MTKKTRGDLAAASIVNLANTKRVYCMFNPFEYTLTKTNQFVPEPAKGKNTPKVTFKQGGSQILKLSLHFDTQLDGTDVRDVTDPLWDMMMVNKDKENPRSGKSSPPEVAFEWGRLEFKAYITSLNQKFTLFKTDGTPIRCTVDITLEQYFDVNDYKSQNAIAAGGSGAPEKTRTFTRLAGERPDNLAAKSGDPEGHRKIAEKNNIDNPMKIKSGKNLKA